MTKFTEIWREGVDQDLCLGVDLEQVESKKPPATWDFVLEDKSDRGKIYLNGWAARELALEILRRLAGKISPDDTLLGFAIYGQSGGGEVYYKANLSDGRYAELHVFETPDEDWREGASVVEIE